MTLRIKSTGSDYILDYRYWKEPESDSLMHYGVLGMHWGVRKAKKEIARGGKDLKRMVRFSALKEYGSLKDERAKSHISKQNAAIDEAMNRRKQKAKEALATNKGKKDIKSNFAAKAEEKRNRKLMPESYEKHDKDYKDEIMLKNVSALSLLGGVVTGGLAPVASVPVINIVRFANRTQSGAMLDEKLKNMSIGEVTRRVSAYAGDSFSNIPAMKSTKQDTNKPILSSSGSAATKRRDSGSTSKTSKRR